MFMLHGRLAAKPGRRDELLTILSAVADQDALPGCRLYVIAEDVEDPDGVWATEIWESEQAHAAGVCCRAPRRPTPSPGQEDPRGR